MLEGRRVYSASTLRSTWDFPLRDPMCQFLQVIRVQQQPAGVDGNGLAFAGSFTELIQQFLDLLVNVLSLRYHERVA